MIKKIIITILILIALVFGYWTISPFFIDKVVTESLPMMIEGEVEVMPKKIVEGSFVGFDKIHNGRGEISIYELDGKRFLRFEEGFNVNNGPDLYVGFGYKGEYVKGSEISKLKGNIGAQNYDLPEDFSLENFDSVYVWCKAFSVPFIKADFKIIE